MDSESANFYFAPTQYPTLYLWFVNKRMLTGKRPNQLRHGVSNPVPTDCQQKNADR